MAEVEEFNELIDSIMDIDSNSVSRFYSIKSGVRLTQNKRDYIRRFIQNEQFMCFSDALYFMTRYAYFTTVADEVFRYDPRDSQKILHTILAEHDDLQWPIELFILKARQLGATTAIALYFLHRILFRPNTRAVMASVQQKQSDLIGRIQETCWKKLPFWLPPAKTKLKTTTPEWANGSVLSIQSGSQAFGIAQGWTPSCIHISEVGDVPNPRKTIEEGLFRAAHSSRSLFFAIEGTGNRDSEWQYEKWNYYKANWGKSGGRFRPFFVPPVCAKDLYPLPDWIRKNPVPANWRPLDETKRMQRKGELFVRSTDYLAKVMGSNFRMTQEYLWYWDCSYREAVASHTEKVFLSQMPCVTGDTLISTEKGIIRIDQAQDAEWCESGKITKWIPKGEKPVLELKTKDGRILHGTRDHLIQKTSEGWCALGDLVPGDKIELSIPMFAEAHHVAKWSDTPIYTSERRIDERMGRLLGYFMGDGSFHSNELTIACDAKDTDTIDDVAIMIEEITGKVPARQRVGNMVRVRSGYTSWAPFLKAVGAIEPVMHQRGTTDGFKRKVCVPQCIFESPKSVVKEFLAALFECDGWGTRDCPRAQLCSAYDPFLRQVQLLLLGFSIRSKMMRMQLTAGAGIKGGKRHQYTRRTLDIPAAFVNDFYDCIGFIGQRKQSTGMRQTAVRYAGKSFEDEVVSVLDTGQTLPVYDISVADSHFFSANGIKVHNCTDDEAFQSKSDKAFQDETIEVITNERQRVYMAYAITGKTILIGNGNQPYEPNPVDIDYGERRIPIRWDAPDGNHYEWELIPLKEFDDSDDLNCMNKLLVFRFPEEGLVITAGVDCAQGLGGPNEDRSCMSVGIIRGGKERDEQACEFTSNAVNSAQMARIVACVAAWYGEKCKDPLGVKLAIEQIRKPGDECQHQLKIMGFYNHHRMVRYDSKGMPDPSTVSKEGWYTTSWSRSMMLNKYMDAINAGWYKPNSPILIRQIKELVRDEKHGESWIDHAPGKHDDNFFAGGIQYFIAHDMENNALRQEARYRSDTEKTQPVDMRWATQEITVD